MLCFNKRKTLSRVYWVFLDTKANKNEIEKQRLVRSVSPWGQGEHLVPQTRASGGVLHVQDHAHFRGAETQQKKRRRAVGDARGAKLKDGREVAMGVFVVCR